MPTCQAPCKPSCDREAVAPAEYQGQPVRVCHGHRKARDREGEEGLTRSLRKRAVAGAPDAKEERIGFWLTADLRAQVEATGVDLSTAAREGIELWLAQRKRRGKI